jgi:hypothetical protein
VELDRVPLATRDLTHGMGQAAIKVDEHVI